MCQIEGVKAEQSQEEGVMANVSALGIDLAKNVFSVHGVDSHGKTVVRKTVTRAKLLPLLAELPPCRVGMEACSGAHHFARELRRRGFDARIMAPKFVAPYRKSGKNDSNDAEAICEAVTRPNMRFVAVKSEEQQAILCLHRVRQARIKERTALINQLRGLLTEFGIVIAKGRYTAQKELPLILEDADNGLPMLARQVLHDEYQRLLQLNQQLLAYDRQLEHLAAHSATAKRLMSIPGIGATTATALVATIGDITQFKNSRELAAWIGLVPRQYSTGGVTRLGRITKHGDKYLRTLLIHGTRSVIVALKDKQDRLSQWIRTMIERRGIKRTCVALAAKNARIAWAVLSSGNEYREFEASNN
jgi:transposase